MRSFLQTRFGFDWARCHNHLTRLIPFRWGWLQRLARWLERAAELRPSANRDFTRVETIFLCVAPNLRCSHGRSPHLYNTWHIDGSSVVFKPWRKHLLFTKDSEFLHYLFCVNVRVICESLIMYFSCYSVFHKIQWYKCRSGKPSLGVQRQLYRIHRLRLCEFLTYKLHGHG